MPTPPGLEYRRCWWLVSSGPPNFETWDHPQTDGVAIRLGEYIYFLRWRKPAS